MTSTTSTGETSSVINDPRRRRAVLWAVCIALMAVVASVSGLNVAQPQLASTFDAPQGQVLWIINTYTLTLAAFLLPLGAVGDRVGRKPVLIAGLIIFGAANVVAAVAPVVEIMFAARALSGIGAAMIMPVTLSVITSSFSGEARSRAIGMWSAVAAGGGLLGMYLSALLVDIASWRWVFALPIVLTILALTIALTSVPNSRQHMTGRYDFLGAVTSVIAVVSLTFALHEAPSLGWTEPPVVIALVVATLALIGFIVRELRAPAPMLDIRYFRTRGLSSGSLLLLVLFGVQAGISLVLYPFFQVVLGWSGIMATLGLMPLALLMMLASGLAPRVVAQAGLRTTMVIGVALSIIGLILMATLISADGDYLPVLPGLIVLGVGTGLAMTPSTEAITGALPAERQGVASAINDLTRELGAALGVALLGGLLVAGYQSAIAPHLSGLPKGIADTAREGVVNAAMASRYAGADAEDLLESAHEAFIAGWQQAMWAGVAVMAVLLIITMIRAPKTAETSHSDN